mgnify:CR=1 FL=1
MRKILSVDDDLMILECFKQLLGDKGYHICTTSNPMDVPMLLAQEQPDLIMLDVHMPQKDGISLFEELKKHDRILPVLFVTAYQGVFDVSSERMLKMWQDYFGDGNVDILYKPFKVENLYEKIEMLIGPADA